MPSVDKYIAALHEATGWEGLAASLTPGVWEVHLDDDLSPVFFALGDSQLVMRGIVATLSGDFAADQALIDRVAHLQISIMRERPSVVALEPANASPNLNASNSQDVFICFRTVPLNIEPQAFVGEVEDWLNDYDWWKKTLSHEDGENDLGNLFSSAMFEGLRI